MVHHRNLKVKTRCKSVFEGNQVRKLGKQRKKIPEKCLQVSRTGKTEKSRKTGHILKKLRNFYNSSPKKTPRSSNIVGNRLPCNNLAIINVDPFIF